MVARVGLPLWMFTLLALLTAAAAKDRGNPWKHKGARADDYNGKIPKELAENKDSLIESLIAVEVATRARPISLAGDPAADNRQDPGGLALRDAPCPEAAPWLDFHDLLITLV